MRVNAVVLVKDRPRLTRQCLESMWANKGDADLTVAIVDDASDDETMDAMNRFADNVNFRIPRRCVIVPGAQNGVVGGLRNEGIRTSESYFGKGDLLVLSDNDVVFALNWADTLIAAFPKAEAFGFKLLGLNGHPFHGVNETFRVDGTEFHSHDAVHGLSHVMRWETWDTYGPYDANAKGTGQSEDWALCRKIVAAGYRVGTIWPHPVANAGLTDSFGKPTPGAEAVWAQTEEFIRRFNLQGKVVME